MLKKLLFAFLVSVVLGLSIFAPVTQAASTWYNQDFSEFYSKVYDDSVPVSEVFGERYTAAQVEWIIYGLFSFAINKATGDPKNTLCFINNDLAACLATLQTLLTAVQPTSTNYAMSEMLFNRAGFSGIGYIREKVSDFRLVPDVQAQGVGFTSALSPVRLLWRASRDIAYFLFVLVAIVFAFMIMFRVKINPQTVITVQSALPKLVLAILLVTFSYAIAGFIIDIMYLVFGLLAMFINQAFNIIGGPTNAPSTTLLFRFLTGEGLGPFQPGIFAYLTVYLFSFLFALNATFFVLNPLTSALIMPILALFLVIGTIVLIVVFAIQFFRIIWMLLKTMANIYLLTIFAPFQIALGVLIPRAGFGAWMRSMFANVMVFPVLGLFFYLAFLFLFQGLILALQLAFVNGVSLILTLLGPIGFAIDSIFINEPWSPPLFGSGAEAVPFVFIGISFVLISTTPKIAELIKTIIAGKEFAYGTAVGEAFAPVQYGWGKTAPYRGYLTGRQIYGGYPGPIDTVLTKLKVNKGLRQSAAQSIWGYRD